MKCSQTDCFSSEKEKRNLNHREKWFLGKNEITRQKAIQRTIYYVCKDVRFYHISLRSVIFFLSRQLTWSDL